MIVGLLFGATNAAYIASRTEYLTHHLYFTFARMMAKEIDRYTLYTFVSLFAIWAVSKLIFKLKGFSRGIFVALVAAGVLQLCGVYRYASRLYSDAQHWLRFLAIKDLFADSAPQILTCAVLIVLVVIMFRRMRKGTRNIADTICSSDSSHERLNGNVPHRMSAKSIAYLESKRLLLTILLPLLLAVNLLPIPFHARNTVALKTKPNVIFIMVDTLRADHLHCYGYSKNTSPNIDRLAEGSLRFEKAISQASWTTASVSSFMTSRYLRLAGMTYRSHPLPENIILLPEALRDNGYTTAASISNPLAGELAGLNRGYDLYYQANNSKQDYHSSGPVFQAGLQLSDPKQDYHFSSPVIDESLRELDKIRDRKFFMFALFLDPHEPYVWRKKHQFDTDYHGQLGRMFYPMKELISSPADSKYVVSLYDGGVASADEYVGKLLDYLKKNRLYDDTLIVFLADHGQELNEHGIWGHGQHLYDESISVPLIVKLPGQTVGRVIKGSFPLIDLFPSVMNSIKIDSSSYDLQGTGFHFSGLQRVRETAIYSSTEYEGKNIESVRTSTRKLIRNRDNIREEQLFNLSSDGSEKCNLISRTDLSDKATLRKILDQKDRLIDSALSGQRTTDRQLTDKDKASMRALGYLQ